MEVYSQDGCLYSYKEPLSEDAMRIMMALKSNPRPENGLDKIAVKEDKVLKHKSTVQNSFKGTIPLKASNNFPLRLLNWQTQDKYESSNDFTLETSCDIPEIQTPLYNQGYKELRQPTTFGTEWITPVIPASQPVPGIRSRHCIEATRPLCNSSCMTTQDTIVILDYEENKENIPTINGKNKVVSKNIHKSILSLIASKSHQKQSQPLVYNIPVCDKLDLENKEQKVLVHNNYSFNEEKKIQSAPESLKLNSSGKQEHWFTESDNKTKQLDTFKEVKCYQSQIRNVRLLNKDQQCKVFEEMKNAKAIVLTMVFQDGSSQLSVSKDSKTLVKGILVLIKMQTHPTLPETCTKDDIYLYVASEEDALWRKDQTQKDFARKLLRVMLQVNVPVICFNAKDFLRMLFHIYVNWKKDTRKVLLDPKIAAWLLDPTESNPSFASLVDKHCEKTDMKITSDVTDSPNQKLCSNLKILYTLMTNLRYQLQTEGLWELFCTIELPLTRILSVMENHKIQVNEVELKRTSEFLGVHLKELEREAHHAAGQKFRLTSSNELREVLFDKLHLHLQCRTRTLPKTALRHLPSTAETVLHQLQDIHPLPKIILQYRQIQKIKSNYVDGLLSCMTKVIDGFVSPTWNQTGTVSGRLSAKHPNIQGVPKLPVQIAKHQYIYGKDREVVTISPRSMFVAAEGYTFLAADFSQIELRLLAHFSLDPELLKLFKETESTDVFTILASQWRDVAPEHITPADREQAKRVAYSVIYGAGKEKLSERLGVTAAEANRFIESFLQKFKVSDFTKRIIQQCHNNSSVVSLMGRKRPLPQINSPNWSLKTQAERQAVNFVIQGSAADLCKMAMIRIVDCIATSTTLTARLVNILYNLYCLNEEFPNITLRILIVSVENKHQDRW
ncbi:DNA polymerase nu [Bombina bombina]|uniref:DNA polymerase nu n=1 Tax=Bombina bombina TaxID=8345 RepID=UPI00235B2C1D|nr:DNA polymerase nu [Bombina bombina]